MPKVKVNCIVYVHKRKSDGLIFYVGISNNYNRPYSKKRSKFWKDYVKKHEYDVEIIHEGLSWDAACIIEINLIQEYGRRDLGLGHLVNCTDGGDGTYGLIVSDERREEMSRYMIENNPMKNPKSRKKAGMGKVGKPRLDVSKRNKLDNPMKRMDVKKKNSNSQKRFNSNLTKEERSTRSMKGINKRVSCIHCNVETNAGNHAKYHGDNCKQKNKIGN